MDEGLGVVVSRWSLVVGLNRLSTATFYYLLIEEAAVICASGECTDVRAAENAVAVSRDQVVERVAEEPRDELQNECAGPPEASELFKDEDDCVGSGEQGFIREIVVKDNVDRIQVSRVGAVSGQNALGERALERGKQKRTLAITAEGELDEVVAESADAIVEEDGRGHGILTTLALRKVLSGI
jgi:hypothetical protein